MPTQYREIGVETARKRLRRTIDFARGEEAELDRHLARIDLRLVNRELVAFGYRIEVVCFKKNSYVPLKAPSAISLEPGNSQVALPITSSGNLGWCARHIMLDLGLPVKKHRNAFYKSEFAKARREYRRRVDAEALLGETM